MLFTVAACLVCMVLVKRKVGLLQASKLEMQRARDAARAATRAKSDFLATMSHEIRTPMNGIIAMTDHLLELERRAEQRELLTVISKSSDHLLAVINDILDFSKLEAGRIELESRAFSIPALVQNVVDMFAVRAREKGLTIDSRIDANSPEWVVGDEARVRQILLNLMSNAVKFTKEGGVRLEVSSDAATPRASVTFVVRDTGIGMSEEALGQLFTEFWQADSSISRKFGGTGLGMAISHRIMTCMGGTIRIESKPGEGSVFRVSIPFDPPSPTETPLQTAGEGNGEEAVFDFSGRRILLVEDNLTNQRIAKTLLARTGAVVEIANNGAEALAAASSGDHDLILMDIHMPQMNGFEATLAIRALAEPRGSVPILALSASAFQEDRARALEVGMNDVLTKPFRAQSFRRIIAKWLPRSSGSDAGANTIASSVGAPARKVDKTLGFDPDVFRILCVEIGEEDAHDLLRGFMVDTRRELETMKDHFMRGEISAMGAIAHALKSSAATLGLTRLSESATELEMLAESGNWSRVEEFGESVYAAHQSARPAIDQILRDGLEASDAGDAPNYPQVDRRIPYREAV